MSDLSLVRLAVVMAAAAAVSVGLGIIWPQLNDNLLFQIGLGFTIGLALAPFICGQGR